MGGKTKLITGIVFIFLICDVLAALYFTNIGSRVAQAVTNFAEHQRDKFHNAPSASESDPGDFTKSIRGLLHSMVDNEIRSSSGAEPRALEPMKPVFPATCNIYPLSENTKLLTKSVSLPETTAPVVYIFPALGTDGKFTSASQLFSNVLRTQVRSQRMPLLCINLIPNSMMLWQYARAFETVDASTVTREQALEDARELGADFAFFPRTGGSDENPTVTLTMIDMNTSRSADWSSEATLPPDATITSKITGAAIACARFAGITDRVITENQMDRGAPSSATWKFLQSTSLKPSMFEEVEKVAGADPDCAEIYMRDLGSTSPVQMVNEGLKRFPLDPRFLIYKAEILEDTGNSTASLYLLSDVVRRFPDMIFYCDDLKDAAQKAFRQIAPPQRPSPTYTAIIQQLDDIGRRHPGNFMISWARASSRSNLADVIRGTFIASGVPQFIWGARKNLTEEALKIMNRACEMSPRNSALLSTLVYYHAQCNEFDMELQQGIIDAVHQIDPRNTRAEKQAIQSHTVGYGTLQDFLKMYDTAVEHHKGDLPALASLAQELFTEIKRQVSWNQLTAEQAYAKPNMISRRFLDIAKQVYASGGNLGCYGDEFYYALAMQGGQLSLIQEWSSSLQNSIYDYKAAIDEQKPQKWQQSYDLAKKALPDLTDSEKKRWCYYYMTKALWKLKRYEEAMDTAREAIMKWPEEQMPLYMYAIEGEECGQHLDAAYDCAYRAVEIDNTNTGCNDTFEKLRKRLNRPEHPRLKAGMPQYGQ